MQITAGCKFIVKPIHPFYSYSKKFQNKVKEKNIRGNDNFHDFENKIYKVVKRKYGI